MRGVEWSVLFQQEAYRQNYVDEVLGPFSRRSLVDMAKPI